MTDDGMPVKPEDVIAQAAMMDMMLDSALVTLLAMQRAEPDEMFGLVAALNSSQRLDLLGSILSREPHRDAPLDSKRVQDARRVYKARNDFAHWIGTGWHETEGKYLGVKRHRGKPLALAYSLREVVNLCGIAMGVCQWLTAIVGSYPSPYAAEEARK